MIDKGREILEESLARNGVPLNNEIITKLLGNFHLQTRDDLYLAVGNDDIQLDEYFANLARNEWLGSCFPDGSDSVTAARISSRENRQQPLPGRQSTPRRPTNCATMTMNPISALPIAAIRSRATMLWGS